MNIGDILIVKTNILSLPKYSKVIICDKYDRFGQTHYKLKYNNITDTINESVISDYFYTLSEYRKLIIEDLI